jgi:hypothetical protein
VVIEKREMSILNLLIINRWSRAEGWTGNKQGAFPVRDVVQEHSSTRTRTEPAGTDARMTIKHATSGIPVFLLLFSPNRIPDRGLLTRSPGNALKSPGHSVATAVGTHLSANYY